MKRIFKYCDIVRDIYNTFYVQELWNNLRFLQREHIRYMKIIYFNFVNDSSNLPDVSINFVFDIWLDILLFHESIYRESPIDYKIDYLLKWVQEFSEIMKSSYMTLAESIYMIIGVCQVIENDVSYKMRVRAKLEVLREEFQVSSFNMEDLFRQVMDYPVLFSSVLKTLIDWICLEEYQKVNFQYQDFEKITYQYKKVATTCMITRSCKSDPTSNKYRTYIRSLINSEVKYVNFLREVYTFYFKNKNLKWNSFMPYWFRLYKGHKNIILPSLYHIASSPMGLKFVIKKFKEDIYPDYLNYFQRLVKKKGIEEIDKLELHLICQGFTDFRPNESVLHLPKYRPSFYANTVKKIAFIEQMSPINFRILKEAYNELTSDKSNRNEDND